MSWGRIFEEESETEDWAEYVDGVVTDCELGNADLKLIVIYEMLTFRL